jgi:16S rRNA (cytosine967-C5)-methyltransferase
MLYQSYLTTAKNILTAYNGDEPFAIFLKKYFAAHKKFGSRDRRYITGICYAYFRLGKAAGEATSDNLLTALFLTEQLYNEIVHFFKPEWDDWIGKPVEEKIVFINFRVKTLFPYKDELSAAVNHTKYCESFLTQPKLFLRLRPHKKSMVVAKLQKAKIPLALIDDECIALANSTKLDDIIVADKEAVIQDYNSQQVFNFIKNLALDKKKPLTAWDCCAASGGKSILLYDILKKQVDLTVSDIRLPILLNLHHRFNKAGVKNYNYFLGDLNAADFQFPELTFKGLKGDMPLNNYQLIVCDAPCTGSGTWSRTPENLFYFKPEAIDDFAQRQKKIVANVIPYLKEEGLLFYITCSVFKKENEDVVTFIKDEFQLQLLHMELLKGYDKKADSMFVAVFSK